MPNYVRITPEEVQAFQVRRDGPTPVPDWFPSKYLIIEMGVVFEINKDAYVVAKWEDFIVKNPDGNLLVYPPELFKSLYKLSQ